MSKNGKTVASLVVVVVALLAIFGFRSTSSNLGGNFNPVVVDFAQGISVGGTQIISRTGAFLGAVTGTSGTLSGSLSAGTFTQGGGVSATTTLATTATLLASDFDTENVIDVTPGGASLTLTLPASSTLPLGTTAGSYRSVWVRNATTSAAINITIAGGAGDLMKSASTTFILQSSTGTSTQARLDFVRRSNSDISVMFTPFNN